MKKIAKVLITDMKVITVDKTTAALTDRKLYQLLRKVTNSNQKLSSVTRHKFKDLNDQDVKNTLAIIEIF
jgi:ABC-type uncharacterized transport system ATPase subunit